MIDTLLAIVAEFLSKSPNLHIGAKVRYFGQTAHIVAFPTMPIKGAVTIECNGRILNVLDADLRI